MGGGGGGQGVNVSFVVKINEPFDTFSVKIYTSKSIQKKTFYVTRKKRVKNQLNPTFSHKVSSDFFYYQ